MRWRAILNPLVILLAVLAGVTLASGDPRAGVMMSFMIALGVGLKLFQEANAEKAAAKLKALISVTATVIRNGQAQEVDVSQLVPGDVVQLSAGVIEGRKVFANILGHVDLHHGHWDRDSLHTAGNLPGLRGTAAVVLGAVDAHPGVLRCGRAVGQDVATAEELDLSREDTCGIRRPGGDRDCGSFRFMRSSRQPRSYNMRLTVTVSLALSAVCLLGCGPSASPPASPSSKSSIATEKIHDAAAATADAIDEKRDEYAREMGRRLDELNVKFEELKERAATAEDQAKKELEQQLERARAKRDVAARKLEELKGTSSDRWEKIQEGVGKAFDDLKAAFE